MKIFKDSRPTGSGKSHDIIFEVLSNKNDKQSIITARNSNIYDLLLLCQKYYETTGEYNTQLTQYTLDWYNFFNNKGIRLGIGTLKITDGEDIPTTKIFGNNHDFYKVLIVSQHQFAFQIINASQNIDSNVLFYDEFIQQSDIVVVDEFDNFGGIFIKNPICKQALIPISPDDAYLFQNRNFYEISILNENTGEIYKTTIDEEDEIINIKLKPSEKIFNCEKKHGKSENHPKVKYLMKQAFFVNDTQQIELHKDKYFVLINLKNQQVNENYKIYNAFFTINDMDRILTLPQLQKYIKENERTLSYFVDNEEMYYKLIKPAKAGKIIYMSATLPNNLEAIEYRENYQLLHKKNYRYGVYKDNYLNFCKNKSKLKKTIIVFGSKRESTNALEDLKKEKISVTDNILEVSKFNNFVTYFNDPVLVGSNDFEEYDSVLFYINGMNSYSSFDFANRVFSSFIHKKTFIENGKKSYPREYLETRIMQILGRLHRGNIKEKTVLYTYDFNLRYKNVLEYHKRTFE